MTGVEMFGPAIAKAAGVGAARAGTWGIAQVLKRRRQKQIESNLPDSSEIAQNFDDLAEVPRLLEYLSQPEVENFTAALARTYLVDKGGAKAEQAIHGIENEFYYS